LQPDKAGSAPAFRRDLPAERTVRSCGVKQSLDEHTLILQFLSGSETKDEKGRTVYFEEDSERAITAREALFKRLLSLYVPCDADPLTPQIRQALALLFTPDDLWNERKIVFKFRKRGSRLNLDRRIEVMTFVEKHAQNGLTRERAVDLATKHFGLSRRQIFSLLIR
jgi:hypothetical protein